jgi:hypothetical protein
MSEMPLPSNRKFGLLFVFVFAVLAGVGWWRGSQYDWIFAVLSGLFLAAALLVPDVLRPLNRAWMGLAWVLHIVTSPIILGVLFFLLFTPVALVMRLVKRDLMTRKFEPARESYWVKRTPPGPRPASMGDQF